jgi:hypothetical protein
MSNDIIQLTPVQALATASALEYLLTQPQQLLAFLNGVEPDHKPALVHELRKCYVSISTQTRTPMSPLRIPAWLT